MRKYSFEEVAGMDQSLHYLATYEITKGMIVMPKSQEESLDLQEKVCNKFNEFKGLIKKGECSFEFIKSNVLGRHGAFPIPSEPLDPTSPEFFKQAEEWEKMENPTELDKKIDDGVRVLVEKLMDSMFPPMNVDLNPSGKKNITRKKKNTRNTRKKDL